MPGLGPREPMTRTAFGATLILTALALAVPSAAADPHAFPACIPGLINPDFTECYGITDDCNGGQIQTGVGHSFSSRDGSNQGGWCWASVDYQGGVDIAVCTDVDEGGGPTCTPLLLSGVDF
jgi:hypothetical protein